MNEFGYTPWGMDFLRLAEPMNLSKPEPLLPRARSVARNGGVSTVFDGREARATVHRGAEASVVSVEFAPMPREVAVAVADVGATPHAVTDDHHRQIVDAGQSPAPRVAGSDCSCKARSTRCLHLLAVLYDITRRVDETPALALSLQGVGQEDDVADAEAPPPRWLPINEIDPREFYG